MLPLCTVGYVFYLRMDSPASNTDALLPEIFIFILILFFIYKVTIGRYFYLIQNASKFSLKSDSSIRRHFNSKRNFCAS